MKDFMNIFNGELGETIEVNTSSIKRQGDIIPHVSVSINIADFTHDEDGSISLLLSPVEAKKLSNHLLGVVDSVFEENYNLLVKQ